MLSINGMNTVRKEEKQVNNGLEDTQTSRRRSCHPSSIHRAVPLPSQTHTLLLWRLLIQSSLRVALGTLDRYSQGYDRLPSRQAPTDHP